MNTKNNLGASHRRSRSTDDSILTRFFNNSNQESMGKGNIFKQYQLLGNHPRGSRHRKNSSCRSSLKIRRQTGENSLPITTSQTKRLSQIKGKGEARGGAKEIKESSIPSIPSFFNTTRSNFHHGPLHCRRVSSGGFGLLKAKTKPKTGNKASRKAPGISKFVKTAEKFYNPSRVNTTCFSSRSRGEVLKRHNRIKQLSLNGSRGSLFRAFKNDLSEKIQKKTKNQQKKEKEAKNKGGGDGYLKAFEESQAIKKKQLNQVKVNPSMPIQLTLRLLHATYETHEKWINLRSRRAVSNNLIKSGRFEWEYKGILNDFSEAETSPSNSKLKNALKEARKIRQMKKNQESEALNAKKKKKKFSKKRPKRINLPDEMELDDLNMGPRYFSNRSKRNEISDEILKTLKVKIVNNSSNSPNRSPYRSPRRQMRQMRTRNIRFESIAPLNENFITAEDMKKHFFGARKSMIANRSGRQITAPMHLDVIRKLQIEAEEMNIKFRKTKKLCDQIYEGLKEVYKLMELNLRNSEDMVMEIMIESLPTDCSVADLILVRDHTKSRPFSDIKRVYFLADLLDIKKETVEKIISTSLQRRRDLPSSPLNGKKMRKGAKKRVFGGGTSSRVASVHARSRSMTSRGSGRRGPRQPRKSIQISDHLLIQLFKHRKVNESKLSQYEILKEALSNYIMNLKVETAKNEKKDLLESLGRIKDVTIGKFKHKVEQRELLCKEFGRFDRKNLEGVSGYLENGADMVEEILKAEKKSGVKMGVSYQKKFVNFMYRKCLGDVKREMERHDEHEWNDVIVELNEDGY